MHKNGLPVPLKLGAAEVSTGVVVGGMPPTTVWTTGTVTSDTVTTPAKPGVPATMAWMAVSVSLRAARAAVDLALWEGHSTRACGTS